MSNNLKLEALCILACELGEWSTEIGAYLVGMPFQNEVGILGGIAAGGTYALCHVYKRAKKHHKNNVSFIDAAGYAGSTESGCIIGATLSEYAAGKYVAATNNPLTLNNALVRGGALIPAFAMGLFLMSAFTYNKKKEVARGITKKGALKEINLNVDSRLKKNRLEIKGKRSKILIKEKKLPATHRKDFDANKDSLYIFESKLARSKLFESNDGEKPEYHQIIEGYCNDLFNEAGYNLDFVENIYSCSTHDEHHEH